MRTYLLKVLFAAIGYLAIHCSIVLILPAPLPAAYWVREMIVVKRHQADRITAPKIVFLGGSSVLFGIDAGMVENAIHIPALNFGLHAGMRLDWILAEGDRAAKRDDIIVLALEPNFYECGQEAWTQWQLYNALAWNAYLPDSLPMKIIAVLRGGSLESPFVKIGAYWDNKMAPAKVAPRIAAMAPATDVIARYEAAQSRTQRFAYSAYNTDDHGDLQNIAGSKYIDEPADLTLPNGICSATKERLRSFIATMQRRGVRVVFEYFPFLIDGTPQPKWTAAENRFKGDIEEIGGKLIGTRDEFFFPRQLFFNTVHHLNEEGRKVATEVIIRHLRKLELELRADR